MPRYTVCAKSPLTGAEGEAEAGGWWGPELKKAGFDAIIIRGQIMKISIVLEGYLKDKYSFSPPIELYYSKAVTIHKILEEAKISSADVFFIKVEDSLVKEDYFVRKSCKIKLFPVIGGG